MKITSWYTDTAHNGSHAQGRDIQSSGHFNADSENGDDALEDQGQG